MNAIAISPDNQTLASGSNDRTTRLWNLKTGKWLYTFAGQEEAVLSVAISPVRAASPQGFGRILASGGVARKISSWQLDTKKFNRTFFYLNPYSHTGFVYSVAFSPDGTILASGSGDKTIRLWGRYTGEVKRTLNGHSDAVLSVAFSPNGKILASASADKTVRLWDLKNWGQPRILSEHLGAVNTVVISPDDQTVITGSTDTTIKLWNLHTGELLHILTGHSAAVVSVAINPDKQTFASSSTDGIINLWDLQTGKLLQTLAGCSPIAFSSNGKTLVSGGKGGTIKIWRQMLGSDELIPESMPSEEWWEVLDIEKAASPKDVKRAYLRLARQYHPDINSSASAKAMMQAINRAYKEYRHKLKT